MTSSLADKDWDAEIGPPVAANWKADADAMPQDVLLHSDTDETEPSNFSKDAVSNKVEENSNADTASAGTSRGSRRGRVETVGKTFAILGLMPDTMKYLESKYQTMEAFEEFLQLSSEEIGASKTGKEDEMFRARFNQADRAKLILVGRWAERNLDGHESKWAHFNKKNFNEFVCDEVDDIILDEILKVLHLNEQKEILKDNGVHSPDSFVEKSKYWYEHEIKFSSRQISQIEKFKRWYRHQLDDYLPSDWVVSFRKDCKQEGDIEWRKVLKAIGLKADVIQALEINDICDFATLIRTSEKWRMNEPKARETGTESKPVWNEWQESGLKENDARTIISFRQWHKFYVAGQKDKDDWAEEFNSAQYKRFVQRYIDPNKPDEELGCKSSWKIGWWGSSDDSLTMSREKTDFRDMLERAAEDGTVTEEVRYRLTKHYDERREKMDLIQEINEGTGDTPFLEERLNQIFKDEAEYQKGNTEESLFFVKEYCQFVFSALVAYFILAIWAGLTINFVAFTIRTDNLDRNEVENKVTENDYQIGVNNISFGLVTAVVVQELSEGATDNESSLYNRFLATYKKRLEQSKEIRFRNWLRLRSIQNFSSKQGISLMFGFLFRYAKELIYSAYTWLILNSSRVYIVSWIVFGALSLVVGVATDIDATHPLFTVGQTWIGIAVTIGYSFFGLNSKKSPTFDHDENSDDEKVKDTDQGTIGGEDCANVGEEAKFIDEREEIKVVKTRYELDKEMNRYYDLRIKAEECGKPEDATSYQTRLDELKKLTSVLPSVDELKKKLRETEEKLKAAVNNGDYGFDFITLSKEVVEMKRKLREEEDVVSALAGWSGIASSSQYLGGNL